MSDKIPTAEEFFRTFEQPISIDTLSLVIPRDGKGGSEANRIINAAIQFAQLHVEAALKAAAEKAEGYNEGSEGNDAFVDKQSILNAYPKENIK